MYEFATLKIEGRKEEKKEKRREERVSNAVVWELPVTLDDLKAIFGHQSRSGSLERLLAVTATVPRGLSDRSIASELASKFPRRSNEVSFQLRSGSVGLGNLRGT